MSKIAHFYLLLIAGSMLGLFFTLRGYYLIGSNIEAFLVGVSTTATVMWRRRVC